MNGAIAMITKQELNDKIESMNESLKKKDEQILKMEIEIENLKYKLKTKKGYDADIEKIREKERKNLKYNNNELENINKDLSEENKKLQNELDYYKFEKNIRGAGRKPKTTPEQIENVQK